jgi:hypothetical protein
MTYNDTGLQHRFDKRMRPPGAAAGRHGAKLCVRRSQVRPGDDKNNNTDWVTDILAPPHRSQMVWHPCKSIIACHEHAFSDTVPRTELPSR